MFARALVSVCALAALTLVPDPAAAQKAKKQTARPQYTAQEVVRFFSQQLPPTDQGGFRALCIGSESECKQKRDPLTPAGQPSFDLLITFDHDSARLTPLARRNLDEFAAALKTPSLATRRFVVEGHTDAKGTPEYNIGLSKRRAAAASRYLASRGVRKTVLDAKGFGEANPRLPDPLDPGNRRVEARLGT